jgi:hypothetical protein
LSTDQPITAFGNVVSAGSMPVGSYVTMQLVDGGNGMLFCMGGGDQVSRSARSSTAAKPTVPTAAREARASVTSPEPMVNSSSST